MSTLQTILETVTDPGWITREKAIAEAKAATKKLILDLGERSEADMKALKKLVAQL